MKKSITEEMLEKQNIEDNKNSTGNNSPSSTKTEIIINKSVSEILEENLIMNINAKLSSINMTQLYNDILMDNMKCQSDIEKLFFEIISLFWIKCRHFNMPIHMSHIMYVHDILIKQINMNKYLALDLLIYMLNINFVLPKKNSFNSMYL